MIKRIVELVPQINDENLVLSVYETGMGLLVPTTANLKKGDIIRQYGVGIGHPVEGEGLGYRHVIGLICLVAKATNPYIRFPESFLHPSAQAGLADLFSVLTGNTA